MSDNKPLSIDSASLSKAQALVAQMPGRVTQPRIAVCAALLAAGRPVCHQHLQVMNPDINRVSIYRVCEWLAEQGYVDVMTGKDGIRRYAWRHQDDSHHQHAHFHCDSCGRTECLEDIAAPRAQLPQGYQASTINVVINGQCAQCSQG